VCYLDTMIFRGISATRSLALAAHAAVCAFTLGSWIGCSSTTAKDVAAGADASPEATAPDDAADGGTVVSDDGAAPADASSAADHVGAIFAISDTTAGASGPKSSHRAGASFTHVTSPDGTTKSKTVGPCLVEIIGDGPAAKETDLSAGIVHITGGSPPIDLTPKSDNTYGPSTGATSLYGGGESLVVTADGKDVPAFTTSLTAPGKITLAAPVITAGALTVKRSTGVSATFSGTSSGVVVLYFSATSASNAFAATCTFDASAGSGAVPAAAFADFPAGPGTFDFYVKQSAVVMPAGWEVHFTASKAVVDPAGIALAGDATFE
jgi:hypothetical protein